MTKDDNVLAVDQIEGLVNDVSDDNDSTMIAIRNDSSKIHRNEQLHQYIDSIPLLSRSSCSTTSFSDDDDDSRIDMPQDEQMELQIQQEQRQEKQEHKDDVDSTVAISGGQKTKDSTIVLTNSNSFKDSNPLTRNSDSTTPMQEQTNETFDESSDDDEDIFNFFEECKDEENGYVCNSKMTQVHQQQTQFDQTTMERRVTRNMIRSTTHFLIHEVRQLLRESSFLRRHHTMMNGGTTCRPKKNVPLFHRSEIVTGRFLGKGGFADVYEIMGYQLDPTISCTLSSEQQELRKQAVRNAIDPITQRGRHALKQLRECIADREYQRILEQQQSKHLPEAEIPDFHLAAIDLVVEGMYLSALDHPSIIKVHGLPCDGIHSFHLDGYYDSYFLIVDRLDETLDSRIKNGWVERCPSSPISTMSNVTANDRNVPSIMEKTRYAYQIASALQYLHEHRIVYRDLKPQNIGLTKQDIGNDDGDDNDGAHDRIVLFDFGLCRELPSLSSETREGIDTPTSNMLEEVYEMSGVGTRRYMAPEIINECRYNAKIDVYSWSMVFWEMLTHIRPFPFHTIDEHRLNVCKKHERPALYKKQWSLSIQGLLKRCWTPRIEQRYDIHTVCTVLEDMMAQEQRVSVFQPKRQVSIMRHNQAMISCANDSGSSVPPLSPTSVTGSNLEYYTPSEPVFLENTSGCSKENVTNHHHRSSSTSNEVNRIETTTLIDRIFQISDRICIVEHEGDDKSVSRAVELTLTQPMSKMYH